MGANPQPSEVGPLWDLLLQTRDGQPISVLNGDRQPVQVASVAYMTTISEQSQQHEETELQHKDQVVQLASPNLIDRELDQWPQISQGDWSGGGLQRVLTGSTPLTSFQVASDPTRYWDGLGLLYPLSDYVPQQPLTPLPVTDSTGHQTGGPNAGVVEEPNGQGFRFAYLDITAGNKLTLVTYSNNTRTSNDISAMGGAVNDLMTFGGATWLGASGALWYFTSGAGLVQLAAFPAGFVFTHPGNLAGTMIGNRSYVAAAGLDTNNTNTVLVYDVTNFASATFTSGAVTTLQVDNHIQIKQILFSGSNLLMLCQASNDFFVIQYGIVSTQFTTLAHLPGFFQMQAVDVGGTIFLYGSSEDGAGQITISMWLLQGTTLQDIGPLTPPVGIYPGKLMLPNASTPYAFFGFTAQDAVGNFGGNVFRVVYAYDVQKGKLFHFATLPVPSGEQSMSSDPAFSGHMAIYRGAQRPFQGQLSLVDFGVVLPLSMETIPLGGNFTGLPLAQELMFNVTQTGLFGPKARGPLQIISSIIDFTSDQGKLFRQGVVKLLTPLVNHPSCAVQLDVWLDQDPDALATVPDFSVFLDGTGRLVTNGVITQVAPGGKRMELPINTLATKLVYRLTTYGSAVVRNGSILSAPKPKSVAIRIATGWVQVLMLDIAPQVAANGKNVGDAWTYQGIDATTAYNFIRGLWRLRGGECNATFPNGDSGPWLLQDAHFDTPKPMGAKPSFRADQKTSLKYIAQVKLREDIL